MTTATAIAPAQQTPHEMVLNNQGLVATIAKRYAGMGLDLADLKQEGNLGLLRAIKTYDADSGYKFTTYASHWIKQSIRRALNNSGRTVRLPSYMADLVAKWKRTAQECLAQLGREATESELASRLGITSKRLAKVKRALLSTTTVQGEAGATEEGWTIDELAGQLEAPADKSEAVQELLVQLDTLPTCEATILRLRFGLNADATPLTLRETAAQVNLTGERVRQLERNALTTLRQRMAS